MKKNSCWSSIRTLTIGCGSVLVTGCGSINITSQHIPKASLQQVMQKPGIYYTLPKTEVQIAIPVALEVTRPGTYGEDFDKCVQACRVAPTATALPGACVAEPKSKITLGKPELTLKSVPDYEHLYMVQVEPGAFESVKHAVSLSESGILTESSASTTSVGFELAMGIASTFVKSLSMVSSKPKLANVDDKCADVKRLSDLLNAQEVRIKDYEARRDGLFPKQGKRTAMDARNAKLAGEHYVVRIKEARDRIAEIRADAKLDPEKKTYKSRLSARNDLTPKAFTRLAETIAFREEPFLDDNTMSPVSIPQEILAAGLTFKLSIEPVSPVSVCSPTINGGCGALPDVSGYRYRIPVLGKAKLTCESTKLSGPCKLPNALVMFEDEIPIAQFGPLATLPSNFRGKGGSVQFSIHDKSGGIKKVEIGSEALPASAVTGTFEALRTTLEERRKQSEKDAQAALDAEKNDLTRERDVLKLRKEIQDLKKTSGD